MKHCLTPRWSHIEQVSVISIILPAVANTRVSQTSGAGCSQSRTSTIFERRRIEWAQPNRIHPQLLQIRHARGDPLKVADAVAVGIGEGAGVDLLTQAWRHQFGPAVAQGREGEKEAGVGGGAMCFGGQWVEVEVCGTRRSGESGITGELSVTGDGKPEQKREEYVSTDHLHSKRWVITRGAVDTGHGACDVQ
jgi:hypothetical protein